jgi:hypothetical protein
MTALLSILLIALGLLLWFAAGLLPVARLRKADEAVALMLQTTWMGAFALTSREIGDVHDARFVQDPNARGGGELQIRRNRHWEPLSIGLLSEPGLQAQLAEVVRRYLEHGGPSVLGLPMRGRLHLMLGFAICFPLGTVSIFTGALLLTSAL